MSITTIPNLHIFELQEVVDYRQLNSNFSEINNHMLHYVEATVTAYNTATFETTVSYNNNTFITLINRTGNVLTVGDSVYIYYWEDMESDGYIGLKLGLPNVQGGDSVTIGEYLNDSNNSLLLNDLTDNTTISIQDNNIVNNLLLSNSKIFYDTTLHSGSIYGSAFANNSIVGTNIKLYDVLCNNSQILGNNIQINSYASYNNETNEYTFKSLYLLDSTLFAGNNNTIQDNRETFSDTTTISTNSVVLGYNASFSLYDSFQYGQGIYESIVSGVNNTLSRFYLSNVSIYGNSNNLSNMYLSNGFIFGNSNSVSFDSTTDSSGNAGNDTYIIGARNTMINKKIYSACYISGTDNSFSNFYNSGSGTHCYQVYIGGHNNSITNAFVQHFYAYGTGNTIASSDNNGYCDRTVVGGNDNNIKFGPSSNGNNILGTSNTINSSNTNAGNLRDFSLLGNYNSIFSYYVSGNNNFSHSLLIGDFNTIGSIAVRADHLYDFVMVGNDNSIANSSVTDTNRASLFGHNNTMNGDIYSSHIIGTGNDVNQMNQCFVEGSNNSIVNNTSDTYTIADCSVIGNHNKMQLETLANSDLYDSHIFGSDNNLLLDYIMNYTQVGAGHHTIIGNYGMIKYSVNSNAHKIKMVFAIDSLYDSSVANSNGNAVTIDYQGNMNVVGTVTSAGADFAEYWEWQDGNVNDEDRRGLFVTLAENGYVKIANSGDKILGIVSAKPTITGGDDNWEWHDKYLKDVFGEYIYEEIEEPVYEDVQQLVTEGYVDETDMYHEPVYETVPTIVSTNTIHRRKLNPNYDPTQVYTNRKYRKEYVQIAHLGKLVMVDDGNCVTGDYLTTLDNGIATKSETFTKFVCIKRIDENHIYVLADYFN